jgi:hypothetical protein
MRTFLSDASHHPSDYCRGECHCCPSNRLQVVAVVKEPGFELAEPEFAFEAKQWRPFGAQQFNRVPQPLFEALVGLDFRFVFSDHFCWAIQRETGLKGYKFKAVGL